MKQFKEVNKAKFELHSALTWGVKKDKNFGYSVPVAINDDETIKKIGELSEYHKTVSPLYGIGNTIYLRTPNLSPKQRDELYEKGRLHVDIEFELYGVNTQNDTSYLALRITKLRMVESGPYSLCPED